MAQAPELNVINELHRAGLLDLANALQLVLVRIGETDEIANYFEHFDGQLDREVRDLAHHVLHRIPDPGVTTWLQESTAEERRGIDHLVAARRFGYRDDNLVSPRSST